MQYVQYVDGPTVWSQASTDVVDELHVKKLRGIFLDIYCLLSVVLH